MRTFNGYGELESQRFAVNGQNLTSWKLTFDKPGRISSKTETLDGITSDYAYTYDSMGRLLNVTRDGTLMEEYQYDSIGRRTYEMNVLKGISGRTFSYSDEDHLITAGDMAYQYDVDGFLTTKTQGSNITRYNYSSKGELLNVNLPDGGVIEYINDPLGRRIAKKVDGVTTEKYLWQGLTKLLAMYDGTDNLMMRFDYADARMPVAMNRSGVTYYLTYDQVGSLRVLADALGNVVKRIDYDSFGNIINDTNPGFTIPFGFAGGLHDRDTGFVRFGFRDYDPNTGRWTAKDPILFAGGDVDLYGYVGNNPVNRTDPSGLQPVLPAPIGPGYYGGGPGQTVGGVVGWYAGAIAGGAVGLNIGLDLGMTYGALIGLPAGPLGNFGGALVGGFAGGVIGGVVGGVGGGFLGRSIGHQFDQPCAGILNCGEEEMLQRQQQKAPCK